MAAVDRRRAEPRYLGAPQTTQAPPLHHHHSISNSIMTQPPHAIAPHPSSGRPGLDRAHTFPTPPTSASSIMGMGNQGSSYEWGGSSVSAMQGNPPLSIDTGLSNTRSVPTTPATTPPGSSLASMPPYSTSQGYDASRQLYSAPPIQGGQFNAQHQQSMRYGQNLQPSPFPKSDMAPPTRGSESEQQVAQGAGDEEADHEHDTEYTHTSAPHTANRSAYGYSSNPAPAPLHDEHAQLSPEMTGSPAHQNGSGRATPRTTVTSQTQWSGGYGTPQRAPASNLYSVMSDTRGNGPSGATTADGYPTAGSMPTGYPSQYTGSNGATPSNKRVREIDDGEQNPYGRPASREASGDPAMDGLKRRRTVREGSAGVFDRDSSRPLSRTKSAIHQRRR